MNWQHASLIAAALLAANLTHAADLTIPAGQAYTVGAAQSDLRLDHLTVGDNARITFAPGVSSWRVYAKQASIGQNVVIDGRGAAGPDGENGIDRSGDAKDCEAGRPGGNGVAGGVGGDGVAMTLWLGIESLGNLAIQTDGGAGGNGGKGGKGQNSGKVNRCDGPHGGAGGNGGAGGSGGKGGAVAFTSFATAKTAASAAERVRISSSGGRSGSGGLSGVGGDTVEGKFQRTPAGDRWFKGGEAGAAGAVGAAGSNGSEGVVQFQTATADAAPAWRNEIGSASAPSVALLQQQVQALQANTAVTAPSGQSQSVPQLLQQLQRRIDELEQRVLVLEKR